MVIETIDGSPQSVPCRNLSIILCLNRVIDKWYTVLLKKYAPPSNSNYDLSFNPVSISLFLNKTNTRFYNSEKTISLPFQPFNFSAYFQNKSSSPRILYNPRTIWRSGPIAFSRYMNREYIPFHKSHTNTSNPIVYIKKGTTGIAGQMRGVCDVLLLSIIHNRVLKGIFVGLYACSICSCLTTLLI